MTLIVKLNILLGFNFCIWRLPFTQIYEFLSFSVFMSFFSCFSVSIIKFLKLYLSLQNKLFPIANENLNPLKFFPRLNSYIVRVQIHKTQTIQWANNKLNCI